MGTRSLIARRWRIVSAAAATFARSSAESCGGSRSAKQAGVEAAGRVDEPEQRFVGEREERAAQDAGQADFVGRAGDGAEQVQHVVDFLLGVKGVAADEVIVEARIRGVLLRTPARR